MALFAYYTKYIQALPGTKFYINGNDESIIVGYTGIYELDSNILHNIYKLRFDNSSIDLIANNDNAYLLVDIVYEE